MNKKIKHRILGILVVIALVILLLPFLQSNHERTEIAQENTPPFPTQPQPIIADDTIVTPTQASNEAPMMHTISHDVKTVEEEAATEEARANHSSNIIPISSPRQNHEDENYHKNKANLKHSGLAQKEIKKKLLSKPTLSGSQNLMQLKEAAWVIQLGHFQSKSSALKLLNRLREHGYPAFMQAFSDSTHANQIAVFVGPENGKHQAFKLADQLEQEMKVKGIVISYQPLAL